MNKIAIIGLSCLFPGATNPEQYWQNLIDQTDSTSLATREQMGVDPRWFYHPEKGQPDKYYCQRGGYIRDFQFDARGYRLAPEQLESLDPMFQWSLYVAKQALQDSGYFNPASLTNCGVILGNLSFPTRQSHTLFAPMYQKELERTLKTLLNTDTFHFNTTETSSDPSLANAYLSGYLSALVTQALGLSGMNLSLDAACASSLYAIKLACYYLESGKTDLMLAGAVSAADPLFINMGFSIFQAYPTDNRTRPLDQSSQGLVAGEGASIVVLKRYADAVRDGDRIYAVIRGIGLSNDGKGKFVLSPNPKGQILAFERAYAEAGLQPSQIDYIECHATGTPLGDSTELNSMDIFFGQYNTAPRIGSVKANLGHLLTAAGMASLLKVILSMNKGIVPATPNIEQALRSQRGLFTEKQIVRTTTALPQAINYTAVNAFGFGGTNAHLILEGINHRNLDLATQEYPSLPPSQPQPFPLAIVGMEAHFGLCDGLDAFDRCIYEGNTPLIPVPPERWKGLDTHPSLLMDYGLSSGEAPHGAYIPGFEIDFLQFKIPPREDDHLIPQHLLTLKVADQAIKDSRLQPGGAVAVIVAMGTELALHEFRGRWDLGWQIRVSLEKAGIELSPDQIAELERVAKDSIHSSAQLNQYTSCIGNIIASRIAAQWDFSGPAFTISAAENSTFRALEVAQLMLAAGEVTAVVVSAIDLAGSFEQVLSRQRSHPINLGVQTLSFDRHATGWTVGEGAGAIVVKPYETAQRDGDRIYAVMNDMSLLQGSPIPTTEPSDLSSSSSKWVTQSCKQAWTRAGIHPREVGYLEVFGSGVVQEDEAEIQGLLDAYQLAGSRLSCGLGSVKANIGHTGAASGMASIIKTALCLFHRYIPAVPQWTEPKFPQQWQDSPFYVPTKSHCWFLEAETPRRVAAINGLGQDNVYAHLILSEAPQRSEYSGSYLQQMALQVLAIAADDRDEMQTQLQQFQRTLEQASSLATVARQLFQQFQSRSQAAYRLVIVGHTPSEVLREIHFAFTGIELAFQQKTEWKTPLGSYFTAHPLAAEGKIAFVYPGMASSAIGLGRDLFRLFPTLYDRFSRLTNSVSQVMQVKQVYPRSIETPTQQKQVEHVQTFLGDGVAMCQSGISLAMLHSLILRDYFQVQPQAAFGYSLGEASSMFFALGVWHDEQELSQRLTTSPLFQTELCGPCDAARHAWTIADDHPSGFWGSYLLKASVSRVKEILKTVPQVALTFINTPDEVVIAGSPAQCLEVATVLQCQFFPVNFQSVLHSPIASSTYDQLVQLHQIPVHPIPDITFYSGVTLAPLVLQQESLAHNSAQLCCQTVDFPALIHRVYEDGVRLFVELGAGNSCSRWIHETLQALPHAAMSFNMKGKDDHTGMIRLLAQLVSHGVEVNLAPLYPVVSNQLEQPKSLIKPVILGGCCIHTVLLTQNNQQFLSPALQVSNAGQHRSKQEHPLSMASPSYDSDSESAVSNLSHPLSEQASLIMNPQESQYQLLKILQFQIETFQANGFNGSPDRKQGHALPLVETSHSGGDRSPKKPQEKACIWDEADLLEFAEGKIASVFGEKYAVIDTYARRVRLPMPPYLLVSRVTKLKAEPEKFEPCSITTEYDIPQNAWYSVDGQIPWAVAVESGQCDLLLISYLGIDFENKGHLVYRLLDCTLTFLEDLPKEGETLRYDIQINSFVRSGNNLLFFFSYECFVGDTIILKMDGGCAGFFSDEQLEQGKGIIVSAKELKARARIQKQAFEPLLICQKTALDRTDLLYLTQGNLRDCFGDHYWQEQRNPSLRLPSERMLMIDRITSIDPAEGLWGLGVIVAEKILEPDHWYFPCHFKDDQVMAGSLMAEGCGQLLQVYMLYLGLQTCMQDARFQPIPNLRQVVRCRGQVTPMSGTLTYRMEITDIGFKPKPYVTCNVEIILNAKVIVHFQDLGLQLSEKNPANTLHSESLADLAPRSTDRPLKPALLNEKQIAEFCTGTISNCFGPEYKIYDTGNVNASRMPNTHLNLVHRVLTVEGERHQLTKGSAIITEYDVPLNPWYCRQNSSPTIPYSILMEMGLQPCGFLSAYLGTTLMFPEQSLYFRNLDGKGHLLQGMDIRGKTIINRSTLRSSSNIQGMIIQNFDFQLRCEGVLFYQGEAAFGHFSPEALSNQVGLDRGQYVQPWYKTMALPNQPSIEVNLRNQEDRAKFYRHHLDKPHYALAQHQLDLLHEVLLFPEGGKYGQGYVYAHRSIQPSDWYFKCHFHHDPVMPGSLGVEAMLQALQVYALQLNLDRPLSVSRFINVVDHTTVWKYRGQIPQGQTDMALEIHLKTVDVFPDRITLIGEASLWKPGLRIYEVKDLAVSLGAEVPRCIESVQAREL